MYFDAAFSFHGEHESAQMMLFQHIFTVELEFVSRGIEASGEAIMEAIATFGSKTIATGCVRLMNTLDDTAWFGKGSGGCLILIDGLYDVPELVPDLLDVQISCALARRSWACFKNPEFTLLNNGNCVEVPVLHLYRSENFR